MDPVVPLDWPVAGRDYPADWDQFLAFFPDEAACLATWSGSAGPTGSSARLRPGPATVAGIAPPPGLPGLGHQTTVTAGTLFQGTRTPLRTWFAAAWLVATAEQGVSARQLARALDLGSYETAWTMLHRFRRAMVLGRPRLEGRVELATLDAPGRPDPAAPGRVVAAMALEDRGETPGRVRMQRPPSPDAGGLAAFAGRVVEPAL